MKKKKMLSKKCVSICVEVIPSEFD